MKRFLRILTTVLIYSFAFSCSENIQSIESLFNNGHYEEAIEEVNHYMFFHVTDIKALHIRARSYEELGELEKARADYERILDIDNQYAGAHAGLGKLLFDQEDYKNAELRLLRAATLDPNNFDIYYLLGRTLLMTGNFKLAEEMLRKASDLEPEFPQAYFYTGIALAKQGDALGCAAIFNTYLKYEPDNMVGRYNRGFAMMNAGFLEWAIEDFDAVLKKNPNHIEAMAKKGLCLASMGDSEGCLLLQNAANKGSKYAKAQLQVCNG
ncbi:tetratricopeptide repeat protein [Algoriphagus halophytocola]|uniref:Tetratricopeptide repeat protein n=1 Tax=Algoriphagus halophytocola TaxID=2991499 RepID=A0ABY6MIM7_9BACT|nr:MULTISPECIES: tetratricopeptide repeat protein [unclassified Algoriphagus]UZD23645.1 tetratricopeptide repeat protein [Algoriphagus sp. TR-M5]WBL44938.1 tetratricopeptide repeat protein [Algoriphagus sp. TR-M9]